MSKKTKTNTDKPERLSDRYKRVMMSIDAELEGLDPHELAMLLMLVREEVAQYTTEALAEIGY